ncbi:DUF4422 domain-containing protein [Cronobacter muytjensii]|nr:DUF4422 domain-containing protein [Cronobacter muytjensii]
MKIKILVCHHRPYPFVRNECFLPIHVGKETSNHPLDYAVSDNTGDNISEKNDSWCELTALYWAWKNLDADYFGLMHYRRLLHFGAEGNGCHVFNNITQKEVKSYGWTPEIVEKVCSRYDVITGPVWNIHPVGLPENIMNARDFYAREHDVRALDIVTDIVKERYPDCYLPLLQSLSETTCVWGNIAVMKSLYFQEYCSFLFDVLTEAERRIDISGYDKYQRRVFGFLAERLLNAWLTYARNTYPGLRTGTLPLVYGVAEKPALINLHPEEGGERRKTGRMSVCMSFDDAYAAHASVAITSMLANAAPGQEIDVFIICDARLCRENREKIRSMSTADVTFHFLEVEPGMLPALPLNRQYISLNTYYRLLMLRLLPSGIDKVLYLDSDVVVCSSLADLWDVQMDDCCIAGVPDEGGVLQARRLHPHAGPDYINAGVLLFNIAQIGMRFPDMLVVCAERYYRHRHLITLQDQDILNITFRDSIYVLPLKWNVSSRMFTYNDLEHGYSVDMATEAINAPGILHYTDSKKPWNFFCEHPLRHLYWQYRSQCPFRTLSLREKFIRRYQGRVQYTLRGNSVALRICRVEFSLPRKIVFLMLKILRHLR